MKKADPYQNICLLYAQPLLGSYSSDRLKLAQSTQFGSDRHESFYSVPEEQADLTQYDCTLSLDSDRVLYISVSSIAATLHIVLVGSCYGALKFTICYTPFDGSACRFGILLPHGGSPPDWGQLIPNTF